MTPKYTENKGFSYLYENIAKFEVFLCKYYGTTATSLNIFFDTNLMFYFFDPSPSGFSVALIVDPNFIFVVDLCGLSLS